MLEIRNFHILVKVYLGSYKEIAITNHCFSQEAC